jgi:hypothetical protein
VLYVERYKDGLKYTVQCTSTGYGYWIKNQVRGNLYTIDTVGVGQQITLLGGGEGGGVENESCGWIL